MRAVAVIALSVVALAGVTASAAGGEAATASAYYLVRQDLRLCPSPMCGGAWARRANHATTRCVDGSYARECYVASTTGVAKTLWSARAGSVLVRGRIVPAGVDGFPDLGKLTAVTAWRAAGQRQPRGTTFSVVDNGVRCVTSPCFSLTAFAVETSTRRPLSDVDLAAVGATPADLRRAQRALTGGGLLVTGSVRTVQDAGPAGAGRVLRATQVWLRP